MLWKRPKLNNRLTLLWDITDRCNLRCKHCYNGNKYFTVRPSGADTNNNEADQTIRLAESITSEQVDFVHFLGGEPFLSPVIFPVTKILQSKGIKVGVNTNGTLLADNYASIRTADFDQIVVSLDSPHREINDLVRGKGVYARVERGLDAISALSTVKKVISWTLTRPSLHQPDEAESMFALCKKFNIHTLSVNWLFHDGFANEHADLLSYKFSEIFPLIEQIAQAASMNGQRLQLDARPRLVDYLNRKYSLAISLTPDAAACKGSRSHFMLRSNGDLFPCAPLDGPYGVQFLDAQQLTFKPPNLTKVDMNSAINSDAFLTWKEVTAPPILRPNSTLCNACRFQDICQPCPLVFVQAAPAECQYVQTIT